MDDRRFQVRKFGNFKLDRVQFKFSEFPNLNLTIVHFEILSKWTYLGKGAKTIREDARGRRTRAFADRISAVPVVGAES